MNISVTNELLQAKLNEKNFLIAVHRGAWSGSIVENTVPAYKAALAMGADMFECDVIKSTDGVLYTFHNGNEMRLVRKRKDIRTYCSKEIDRFTYHNGIGKPVSEKVNRLDHVLESFSHGELFNIDRAWAILPELHEVLQRHPHVLQQAIIKTKPTADRLQFFRECDTKYMYMPICHSLEDLESALACKDINLVGAELICRSEHDPLFSKSLIAGLKEKGLYVWVNAITLSSMEKHILSAGFDDNLSVSQDPALGWGRLVAQGFNVIQTDHPAQLRNFRDGCGKNL